MRRYCVKEKSCISLISISAVLLVTTMGSDDIALVADALSKTHVGDEELSYKGRGLKMDNTESVKELVQEIEYQGLRALRLEGNTVGVEAAQAIAKAWESKDQLQLPLE
uniref:Ran GTPase activating protein 1b n=1 Tax=Hucho hucho TaxID=62062 RepID=A0A4W5R409_9TELE